MGQREDTEEERSNWHWRNSMRPVRFFAFDARAAIPWIILLFHARTVTFVLAIVLTGLFWYMEQRGLTFPSALRTFRTWFLGQKRYSWLPMNRKKMVDFG